MSEEGVFWHEAVFRTAFVQRCKEAANRFMFLSLPTTKRILKIEKGKMMRNDDRLKLDFFSCTGEEVARNLLGKELVFNGKAGIIIETENYEGFDDKASHAFCGRTKRNAPMFGRAGISYVYFIYGMYYCFNVTTREEGFPAAVLIRGLLLADGTKLDGPGKVCRYLGISTQDTGRDLLAEPDFYIRTPERPFPFQIKVSPRVGIKKDVDRLWRFTMLWEEKMK